MNKNADVFVSKVLGVALGQDGRRCVGMMGSNPSDGNNRGKSSR